MNPEAMLLDLDGVLYVEDAPVTGAREAVAELRRRGVEVISEIVDIEGNYPSKGARGERATWFRDSEGNLLGIGQLVY